MEREQGSAELTVLLRAAPDGPLAVGLMVLFGYSLTRALECLERTGQPALRRAITHRVIAPLQSGSESLQRASRRRPGPRLLLPAATVELARRQLAALEAASRRVDFQAAGLPPELREPARLARSMAHALGEAPAHPRVTESEA